MNITDIPIDQLTEAPWNSNQMDEAMLARLTNSLRRFGLVSNLVVRPIDQSSFEVLSGNQRLQVLRELDIDPIPCVIVNLDDANARLLAQALNRIQGSDDLGLRAEEVRAILKIIPQADVLALLPETAESLKSLVSLGTADMSAHLAAWQLAQSARLKHLTVQLSDAQLTVVEDAIADALTDADDDPSNPNRRGNALYLICQRYLVNIHIHSQSKGVRR